VSANNKAILIILDGWGLSPNEHGNAPLMAKTPILDYVYATYPKTSLVASGLEVGLNAGEPGNSEVGHLNIGSGRVVWENLPRIDQAIKSGQFAQNENLQKMLKNVKENDKALHLIGLVSDGGIHSHIRHLISTLECANKMNLSKVYIHAILDGRDTAPKEAMIFLSQLEEATKKYGGKIVDLIGRYYAMDRDNNWDREKKAFDLFTKKKGDQYGSFKEAIDENYKQGKSDENFEPSVIGEGALIEAGDSILFFNHRSDRSRQMLELFYGKNSAQVPADLSIMTMTEYEKNQKASTLFPPVNLKNTISDIVADAGLRQFHTAETEKYAHVTYFLKAGNEELLQKEIDKVVPSKKVAYDKVPAMSASEVTEVVMGAINDSEDFIVVNYANGDMVGHTGVMEAAVEACEDIDKCLGKVLQEASNNGYKAFITADHGNCEVMIDELTKQPDKEHTCNPVPFVFLDFEKRPFSPAEVAFSVDDYIQYATGTPIGVLADIAPSVLANLNLKQPEEMKGMDLSVAMI